LVYHKKIILRKIGNASPVSHLIFPKDSLSLLGTSVGYLLCKFRINGECGEIKYILSPNINMPVRAEICETLHIDTEALSDRY
jgi:hypothetical protein